LQNHGSADGGLIVLDNGAYFWETSAVFSERISEMEKRHENSLKNLLEAVAFEGYAFIAKWKITRWYGQVNFTVAIRRDLRERWNSLIVDELGWSEVPTLRLAEVSGGDIVLMKKTDFYKDTE
jgi:hypothetical protein